MIPSIRLTAALDGHGLVTHKFIPRARGESISHLVRVCDEFAARLGRLVEAHPDCGAEHYNNRVLELRSKCLRLQKMHS